MSINHVSEIKRNSAAKLLLCLGVTVTLFAGVAVSARAQSSVAQRQAETGITTYYYAYKSNAVGKVNAEKKRGRYARMYYDDARRKWAVDVSNGLASPNSPGSTPRNETTASTPQTGSHIYYYNLKSNAVPSPAGTV